MSNNSNTNGSFSEEMSVFVLRNRKLRAANQVPIKIEYKGELVGNYYADIVVENKIILEINA